MRHDRSAGHRRSYSAQRSLCGGLVLQGPQAHSIKRRRARLDRHDKCLVPLAAHVLCELFGRRLLRKAAQLHRPACRCWDGGGGRKWLLPWRNFRHADGPRRRFDDRGQRRTTSCHRFSARRRGRLRSDFRRTHFLGNFGLCLSRRRGLGRSRRRRLCRLLGRRRAIFDRHAGSGRLIQIDLVGFDGGIGCGRGRSLTAGRGARSGISTIAAAINTAAPTRRSLTARSTVTKYKSATRAESRECERARLQQLQCRADGQK
jgi:hypothetical protein